MTIKAIKRISAEDPLGEIWKYLRFFQHAPTVVDSIRQIHNVPAGAYKADLRKQAEQIGYCIRQAEEYFRASSQVGLATRPNLLYYGAVSLTQALILLRQDGSYSLDARREGSRHNHHGLVMSRGLAETARKAKDVCEFFNSLECTCFIKDDSGTPWGHFPLFYQSLVPSAYTVKTEIRQTDSTVYNIRYYPVGCAEIVPIDELVKKKLNVLSLIKTLPDMYYSLSELNIVPAVCRGAINRTAVLQYKPVNLNDVNDSYPGEHLYKDRELERRTEQWLFFLNGVTDEQKKQLISFYNQHGPEIEVRVSTPGLLTLGLTIVDEGGEVKGKMYYPDVVEDVRGTKFFIIDPDDYIHEPATLLIILFCLGMLSRYFPDVWMRAIDENVQVAEMTNSILNTVYRKLPSLVLDQMTLARHQVIEL